MDSDPYVYPGTTTLRNQFGIIDAAILDIVEREWVTQRLEEGPPSGRFDLAHLQAIHCHLFQDVYEWAGHLRTVEIAKGSQHFMHRRFIETGMADITKRLQRQRYLRSMTRPDFAHAAAKIVGDVNYIHPFREGNGRTQLEYLRQLAAQAGYPLNPANLDPKRWIEASRASHQGDYDPMRREILASLSP